MIETFTGFILMMFMSGDPQNKPTEFTPRDSLSHCLSTKRKVLRTKDQVVRNGCVEKVLLK